MPQPKKIVVTGACIMAGMAEMLRLVMPDAAVVQISIWDVLGNPEGQEKLARELADADRWLFVDTPVLEASLGRDIDATAGVRFPTLVFPAFHPDAIVSVTSQGAPVQSLTMDNHSAILLWAYNHGRTRAEAAALFTRRVFEDLGYLDYWQDSAEALRLDFERCDLDHRRFLMRVKRLGCFMHSINHPRPPALAELVRGLLPRLGFEGDASIPFERYAADYLNGLIWPVYPGIGERLGVPPMLTWRFLMDFYDLERYVDANYARYEADGLATAEAARFDGGLYDRVLGAL